MQGEGGVEVKWGGVCSEEEEGEEEEGVRGCDVHRGFILSELY